MYPRPGSDFFIVAQRYLIIPATLSALLLEDILTGHLWRRFYSKGVQNRHGHIAQTCVAGTPGIE